MLSVAVGEGLLTRGAAARVAEVISTGLKLLSARSKSTTSKKLRKEVTSSSCCFIRRSKKDFISASFFVNC
jgi:hypothetical protein